MKSEKELRDGRFENKTLYRVCFEDTDSGGVVYYANYLRYLERGRTELMRERGVSVRSFAEEGILFPVVEVRVRYRAPAFYDDMLEVTTWVEETGRTRVTFGSVIRRQGEDSTLVEGTVTVACVDSGLRPVRMPAELGKLAGEGL